MVYGAQISYKYVYSLLTAMQATLGGDVGPRNLYQIVMATIGVFLGSIINGNIFGELSVIMQGMDSEEKEFQSKMASMNTAMINLELPSDLQLQVRKYLTKNQPSQQTQNMMKEFLVFLSPSIRYKVLVLLYHHVLSGVHFFKQHNAAVQYLVQRIDVVFLEPETIFIKQFDNDNFHIYLTGAGVCNIWRYFDSRHKELLDNILEGEMINEVATAMETAPEFSVESVSYCTIGKIDYKLFCEMITQLPQVKTTLIASIINNPYDHEREFFVQNVKRNIDFFKKLPDEILRQLYYRSTWRFYDYSQKVFKIGDNCDRLYLIMSGVIEISLESKGTTQQLDLMTRGSILGIYGILKQDPWNVQAIVVSQQTAQVLEISSELIKSFTALYPSLNGDLDEVSQRIEVSGRPHIDYIIDKTPLNKDEINFIVQDFKNNR